MNKADLLALIGKGVVSVNGTNIEVYRGETLNDYIYVIQKAINEFTTDQQFGGFEEFITDCEVAKLDEAFAKTKAKMEEQATLKERFPTKNLTKLEGNLLKDDNNRVYEIQYLKDHFEIYTTNKWSGGYEASCPINVPIVLEGKYYYPKWSFWLEKGCYMIDEEAKKLDTCSSDNASNSISNYIMDTFVLDGYDNSFVGFTQGVTWNNWQCPYFELGVALEIGRVIGEVKFDESSDTITIGSDENPEIFNGQDIVFNNETKHVYAIGAWSWCWLKANS